MRYSTTSQVPIPQLLLQGQTPPKSPDAAMLPAIPVVTTDSSGATPAESRDRETTRPHFFALLFFFNFFFFFGLPTLLPPPWPSQTLTHLLASPASSHSYQPENRNVASSPPFSPTSPHQSSRKQLHTMTNLIIYNPRIVTSSSPSPERERRPQFENDLPPPQGSAINHP